MSIFPYFNYHPSKYKIRNRIIIRGEISTYIRKRFDGVYYLCLLKLQYEQPMATLRRLGVPRKSYDNWVMNMLMQRLMIEAYKMIKFSTLTPELTDMYNNPIGFQIDPNQKTEKERLTI